MYSVPHCGFVFSAVTMIEEIFISFAFLIL